LRDRLRLAGLALACVLVACGSTESDENHGDEAETRAIMGQIFEGLRVALPASADPETFASEENRVRVGAALEQLAANAELLESHTAQRDEQMHFLARSVASDAREVQRAYAQGRSERAAFLLHQITENCVVCHTRLPSLRDSPVAKRFLDEGVLEELPLEPRATLQIATRRFDAALDTLEELILSPAEHPAMLLGPLTDYLVVSIRVKQDYERPIPTLRLFAQRPDLWTRLRTDVERWVAALPVLHERVKGKPDLATARALLDEGKQIVEFPEDRSALVHFVVASSVLQRYIDAHTEPGPELAEAFYLLGLIEARIGRNYWVTPSAFLLEKAIRMAPGAPFADDAYALLERETFEAYEGSDWEDLPAEDAARLEELRRLTTQ
jgi:hypothetical protein